MQTDYAWLLIKKKQLNLINIYDVVVFNYNFLDLTSQFLEKDQRGKLQFFYFKSGPFQVTYLVLDIFFLLFHLY